MEAELSAANAELQQLRQQLSDAARRRGESARAYASTPRENPVLGSATRSPRSCGTAVFCRGTRWAAVRKAVEASARRTRRALRHVFVSWAGAARAARTARSRLQRATRRIEVRCRTFAMGCRTALSARVLRAVWPSGRSRRSRRFPAGRSGYLAREHLHAPRLTSQQRRAAVATAPLERTTWRCARTRWPLGGCACLVSRRRWPLRPGDSSPRRVVQPVRHSSTQSRSIDSQERSVGRAIVAWRFRCRALLQAKPHSCPAVPCRAVPCRAVPCAPECVWIGDELSFVPADASLARWRRRPRAASHLCPGCDARIAGRVDSFGTAEHVVRRKLYVASLVALAAAALEVEYRPRIATIREARPGHSAP